MNVDEAEKLGSFIRVNQLRAGDIITDQLERDIRNVTGPRVQEKKLTIKFEDGHAFTEDTDMFDTIKQEGLDT